MTKTPLGLQKKKKKKKKVTNLIQEKNNVYESYQNSKNNNRILGRLKFLQEDLHNEIVSKLIYFFRITYKLIHIQEKSKVYWLLLESVLNNKKIPLITLLYHRISLKKLCFSIYSLRDNFL